MLFAWWVMQITTEWVTEIRDYPASKSLIFVKIMFWQYCKHLYPCPWTLFDFTFFLSQGVVSPQ